MTENPPNSYLDRYFSVFDAFLHPLRLNLKQRVFFKTGFGGILTVIAVAIGIYELTTQLSSMVDRTTSVITTRTGFNQDPGPLTLNSSNFIFALSLDSEMPFTNALVTFSMELGTYERMPDGTISQNFTSVPLEICTRDYFAGFEHEYDNYQLNNALCPSIRSYPIAGSYLAQSYSFIKLQVRKCVNNTQGNKFSVVCAPSDEIDASLNTQGIRVQMYFSENVIDVDNFTTPVQRLLVNENWQILPQYSRKSVDLYLQEQVVESNTELWSLARNKVFERAAYFGKNMREQDFPLEDGKILSLFFRKNQYSVHIARDYMDILDVLSKVGGLWHSIFFLFGSLVAFYANFRYYKDIADEIYQYDTSSFTTPERHAHGPALKRSSTNPLMTQKLSIKYFLEFTQGGRDTCTTRMLPLSYFGFLFSFVFPCNKRLKNRRNLYLKARKKVTNELDLIQIAKKLLEFEKLKTILFDKYQRELLSYTPTPLISLRKQIRADTLSSLSKTAKERVKSSTEVSSYKEAAKFMKLFNSYRMIRYSKYSATEKAFNKELVDMIDKNMKTTLNDLDKELGDPDSEIGNYIKQSFYIEEPHTHELSDNSVLTEKLAIHPHPPEEINRDGATNRDSTQRDLTRKSINSNDNPGEHLISPLSQNGEKSPVSPTFRYSVPSKATKLTFWQLKNKKGRTDVRVSPPKQERNRVLELMRTDKMTDIEAATEITDTIGHPRFQPPEIILPESQMMKYESFAPSQNNLIVNELSSEEEDENIDETIEIPAMDECHVEGNK